MTNRNRRGGMFHNPVAPVKWRRLLGFIALIMVFCTALASAGVVKSKGVKRIVDGPQGEVVVDSVLDNTGVPLVEASPEAYGHDATPAKAREPQKKPSIAGNNDVQYQEPVVNPEDYEKKTDNSMLKLIIVGVLILGLGGGVVLYINKRNN